ncbi:dynamin family protein [Thiolapillus sp.]
MGDQEYIMGNGELQDQLQGFARWKMRQLHTMEQLEGWLKQQGLFTSQAQQAIQHANITLRQDYVTVAIVGEFSRGKTELINSLFFGDHAFRLLPTDAGRTTMCPTEIFQDNQEEPYLRLLPIETRLEETSLFDLQSQPEKWEHIPLKIDDSEDMYNKLLKIKENKMVPRDTAVQMGLDNLDETDDDLERLVSIPAWRLAHLNYRHPLLSQGLRILDTPGLNAVSAEPELTYEILPNAQARLFVLGADTGVTKSDMEMWQQLIQQPGTRKKLGAIVVLNKTDTLWDELRSDAEVNQTIERQRLEVAQILEVKHKQIFAVSAHKGLLGRIKKDKELEIRSGIPKLEKHLAETLVHNRQALIVEQSTELVHSALDNIKTLVASRLKRMKKQAQELKDLSTKSEVAIDKLLKQAQADKARYQASINAYKQSRADFTTHGKILLDALSPQTLHHIIGKAKKHMSGAWTTVGLKEAMRELFDDINSQMEIAANQSQEMRRLIRTIYRRFQTRHGMNLGDPRMLSLITHQVELNLIYQEAEIFRKSPRTTLTEKHFAIKRYFQTVVHRVELTFRNAHNDAKDWLETALDPLTAQVHEHRAVLSQQLSDLKLTGRSRTTVRQRLQALKQDTAQQKIQLATLQKVIATLENPLSDQRTTKLDGTRGDAIKKTA